MLSLTSLCGPNRRCRPSRPLKCNSCEKMHTEDCIIFLGDHQGGNWLCGDCKSTMSWSFPELTQKDQDDNENEEACVQSEQNETNGPTNIQPSATTICSFCGVTHHRDCFPEGLRIPVPGEVYINLCKHCYQLRENARQRVSGCSKQK